MPEVDLAIHHPCQPSISPPEELGSTYLGRIITLTNLLHTHCGISLAFFEVCFADDLVFFFREDVTATDDGDEVLRLTDLALEAFPDLVAREDRGCVGWVDGFGVGAVYGDHFGGCTRVSCLVWESCLECMLDAVELSRRIVERDKYLFREALPCWSGWKCVSNAAGV